MYKCAWMFMCRCGSGIPQTKLTVFWKWGREILWHVATLGDWRNSGLGGIAHLPSCCCSSATQQRSFVTFTCNIRCYLLTLQLFAITETNKFLYININHHNHSNSKMYCTMHNIYVYTYILAFLKQFLLLSCVQLKMLNRYIIKL